MIFRNVLVVIQFEQSAIPPIFYMYLLRIPILDIIIIQAQNTLLNMHAIVVTARIEIPILLQ